MPTEDGVLIQSIQGMAILAAIPAVIFALWAEYLKMDLEDTKPEDLRPKQALTKKNDPTQAEGQDQWVALGVVYIAGLFFFLTQIVIFLLSDPVRQEHPALALAISLSAVFWQSRTQAGLERKIKKEAESPWDRFAKDSRGALGVAARFGVYFIWITLMNIAAALFVKWTQPSTDIAIAEILFFNLVGTAAGMLFNFALAPRFLRIHYPCKALEDPSTVALIKSCYDQAKLPLPDLWTVDLGKNGSANAWIAGFQGGKGWFKPGIFISQDLASRVTSPELRAILMHEIAHVVLSHLRKRLLFSFKALVSSTLIGVTFLLISRFVMPAEVLKWFNLLMPGAVFLSAIWAMKEKMMEQEYEADAFAVLQLGTPTEDLINALNKLDQGKPVSVTHPETAKRALALRSLESGFANHLKAASQDQDRDRAA